MDILKKINQLRLERNWSIYRLSVESNISQSTLTNMFNRETLPSITTLECLCSAFGISMAEFFTEQTSKNNISAEQELLELYRALPDNTQQTILSLLHTITKKSD